MDANSCACTDNLSRNNDGHSPVRFKQVFSTKPVNRPYKKMKMVDASTDIEPARVADYDSRDTRSTKNIFCTEKLTCTFDARAYAEFNPDVKQAVGYDELKLKAHFAEHGVYEGRSPCGSIDRSCRFDAVTYRRLHPDVRQDRYYGRTLERALLHYRQFGIDENRAVCVQWKDSDCSNSAPLLKNINDGDFKFSPRSLASGRMRFLSLSQHLEEGRDDDQCDATEKLVCSNAGGESGKAGKGGKRGNTGCKCVPKCNFGEAMECNKSPVYGKKGGKGGSKGGLGESVCKCTPVGTSAPVPAVTEPTTLNTETTTTAPPTTTVHTDTTEPTEPPINCQLNRCKWVQNALNGECIPRCGRSASTT